LYHYAFFLAWQFLVLLGWAVLAPKASRSMDLARLAGAGLVVALAYGPWLPALAGHLDLTARGRFYFQGFPASETLLANATNLLRKLVLMDAFPDLTLRTPLAGLALLTALLVARPLLTASSGSRRRDLRLFWLSLPLLPGGIFLADYLRETHTIFLMKTTLALLPLGILALAVGAASLPQRWLGTATLALWLAIFLAGSATRVAAAVATPAWKQRVAETLRMHDRETHVVVVSSQDRRFLYPLMMTLRDAGVARVTLSLARGRELHDVLVSLLRDGGAQRLSLVSFVDEPWSDESRREAITAARLFGWRRERHGIPALISLVPGASSRPREASPAR
ncbi:MAG: hypothetical protein ACR2P8_12565, partial [Myxococcota bacterium]